MPERNLDFDSIQNRKNTRSLKYDFAVKRGMPEDVLPLWVADMDFKTSSYIEDALVERCHEAIFGYSDVQTPYFEIVKGWMQRRHNWTPEEKWLVKTPGVVCALATAVRAFTEPGDSVIIQQPVYYPFASVVEDNGRKLAVSNLVQDENGYYRMDLVDFEKKIVENAVKLFILCSPHNPIARVWTEDELKAVGDICRAHGVIVVSDEIHSDFVFEGEHHVFASLRKEYEDMCVICTAPSKTFNLASMTLSNIFIPNRELKHKFVAELYSAGVSELPVFGLIACETAYTSGEEWYQAMMKYVKGNIDFVREYVSEKLPGVKMGTHEGTYLVWLDFRSCGMTAEELEDMIVNKAKLWLDSGTMFGEAGAGFQRINVTCPRSVLKEAMDRLWAAMNA